MRPRNYDDGGPVTSGAVVRCNSQTFQASTKAWQNLSFSTAGASDCSTVTAWPVFPGNVAQFGIINSNAELAAITDVTWEAWINLTGTGARGVVVSKWAQLGGLIIGTTGVPGFYNAGASSEHYGAAALTLGQWYHVAATCSATTGFGMVWINGQMSGMPAPFSIGAVTTWPVYFGQFPGFWPINGQIKACRVYNRMLAAGEITRNFNASRARYQ